MKNFTVLTTIFCVFMTTGQAVSTIPRTDSFPLMAEHRVYRHRLGEIAHVAIDLCNLSDQTLAYALLDSPCFRSDRVAQLSIDLYQNGTRVQPLWLSCGNGIKRSTPLLELKSGERVRSWFNLSSIYHGQLKPGVYEIRATYRMDGYRDMGFTQLSVPERTVARLIVEN